MAKKKASGGRGKNTPNQWPWMGTKDMTPKQKEMLANKIAKQSKKPKKK